MNRFVFFPIGVLLLGMSVMLVIPAIADAVSDNPDWHAFLISSIGIFFLGGALVLSSSGGDAHLNRRDGYLFVIACWVVLPLMASMPFWVSSLNISFADAVFESVSGLTTTGSTILTGLDDMPPGILLWRAMLQWVGGVGIVVMAITLFPFLRIGGMQLYRMESSDQYDKFTPRLVDVCVRISLIYIVLSILCAWVYWDLGMTGFEAVIHAMTTLSTGGFSTSDQSMGHFTNPSIQWAAVVFMLVGSLPFSLYVSFLRQQNIKAFLKDGQTPTFLIYVFILVIVTCAYMQWNHHGLLMDDLRQAAFNVVSVISTTGYASSDYLTWGVGAATLFFFMSLLGGCAGSTAGGLKAFRLIAMVKGTLRQEARYIYPNGVMQIKMGNRSLDEDTLRGVYIFFFIMMAFLGLQTTALTFVGLDFETSISAAVTSIANVGPGLGKTIGPSGTFQPLSDTAKWILDLGMIAGRLEFMALLIIFLPDFWKD